MLELLGIVAVIAICVIVVAAVFAPPLSPHDPDDDWTIYDPEDFTFFTEDEEPTDEVTKQ